MPTAQLWAIPALLLTALVAPRPLLAQWNTQIYDPHALVAVGDTTDVPESSGVVASRTTADVFWTQNDSGNSAQIWAYRLNAADKVAGVAKRIASVQFTGASNVDWEDISTGPGSTFYVSDSGDNPPCDRTNKRIYRITEPTLNPNGAPVSLSATPDSIRFEYPDTANASLPADTNAERYDCETMFVHPVNGDLYFVTKRTDANVPTARVYKLPAASFTWNSATIYVLQFVTDISGDFPITATCTGGDVDTWARRILIRTYGSVYEFTLPSGAPFDNIFNQTPKVIALSGEIQGEGVCYAANGGNIVSTSEVATTGPQTCPFYITPWKLANLQAGKIGGAKVNIHWDTSGTEGSIVDYGLTTAYGRNVSNSAAVESHDIPLTGLQTQSTYYYRVTSGSLIWPQQSPETVSFTTLTFSAKDFDRDDDVDSTDVAHIRGCMTGANLSPPAVGCADADLDGDIDVDLSDFSTVQNCLSGAGVLPTLACLP